MSSFQQPINHTKHNFYHHYAALYMNCQLLIKSFRFIHIKKDKTDGHSHGSTGISPPHGSHPALPIACDAINARTDGCKGVSLSSLGIMAHSLPKLFCGMVLIARLKRSWRTCQMAPPKENVSACPMLSRSYRPDFLCQGAFMAPIRFKYQARKERTKHACNMYLRPAEP